MGLNILIHCIIIIFNTYLLSHYSMNLSTERLKTLFQECIQSRMLIEMKEERRRDGKRKKGKKEFNGRENIYTKTVRWHGYPISS